MGARHTANCSGPGTGAGPVAGGDLQSLGNGFIIGAALFDHVATDTSIYTPEIFDPILCIVRASDYTSALRTCTWASSRRQGRRLEPCFDGRAARYQGSALITGRSLAACPKQRAA
ncbi:aldehyde dehydrogenase family protein [Nocardia testacea]|uniref:aldehyde dehydrogenase family protein n=1 Tax=Nocardia testacea TaxID=248551 RepID=UPI003A8661D6